MIYMETYEHLSGGPCGEGTRGVQSAERAGGEEVTVSDSDVVSDLSQSDICVFALQWETRLLLPEPPSAAHVWRRSTSGAADGRPARLA